MKRILRSGLFVVLVLLIGISFMGRISAATFDQNNIIDDAVFDNASSMSASQIDSWLNTNFGSRSCISTSHGFSAPDPTGYSPTNGFTYGGDVSAGHVIYDASQAYGINPQVLLATLQKEQGIVDGSGAYGCGPNAYAAAAGYGCPDSGTSHDYTGVDLYSINGVAVTAVNNTCVNTALKVGFSQQVIRAAWLLKFGEQRSQGNVGWAVIKGNWDNSDDSQSCYSGPMTQGNWQICPNGSTVYYDGYTSIDGTSVHMDDGATAALYWYTPHFHGNENFFNIFAGWFGNTILPVAFITPGSGTVYIQTDGNKFSVPSMSLLQDFGISPGSIQTISQAMANAIPFADPSTGLSTGLSDIVKSPSDTDSDGSTVWLVSAGQRYAISSMQQFTNFGFNTNNIAYLPLPYIYSLPNGGTLSNFIETPSSNAFQVSGGTKSIIFDPSLYATLNSGGTASFVSSAMASSIPSAMPITNRPILVSQTSGAVYLFDNSTYYSLPSLDVYSCWGFNGTLNTPLYKLSDNSFVGSLGSPISLSCAVNTDSTTTLLLNGSNKIPVPSSFGFSAPVIDQTLLTLLGGLPQRSTPLGQIIKANNGPAVWDIENGIKEAIPSMSDFNLLGLQNSQIDTIVSGAAASIPASGIKLGIGQVIKTDGNGSVYIVATNNSRIAFANGDDFTAYGNSWPAIETFPAAILNQPYPAVAGTTISKYLFDQVSNSSYLMDANGCYSMNSTQLSAYGQSLSGLQASQSYTSSIFPNINLSHCKLASVYVKAPGEDVVYLVSNGQLDPISSWSKLQSLSQQNQPYIITLSTSTLATLPIGPTQ